MNDTALAQDPVPEGVPSKDGHGHRHSGSRTALAVGAVGVVFGDIGTSPLYAFRETFNAINEPAQAGQAIEAFFTLLSDRIAA